MPVDGVMFCLQCGDVVALGSDDADKGPALEDTTDPLLQRAITDATHDRVRFRLPVSGAKPVAKATAFASMRSILAPAHPAVAGGIVVLPAPVMAPRHVAEPPKTARSKSAARYAAKAKARRSWSLLALPTRWLIVAAVVVVFAALNAALFGYYGQRVYPGVHVGQTDLSGVPFGALHQRLVALAPRSKLKVTLGSASYVLDAGRLGAADIEQVERRVRAAGRDTPLPIAGVARMLMSRPLAIRYEPNAAAVHGEATRLASLVNYRASDALPMIVNGQAFVITEKAGSRLSESELERLIREGLGAKSSVELRPDKLAPVLAAGAYKPDAEEAQARLGLSLSVKVLTKTYAPTAAQIGEWLVFAGPGKGVSVDGSRVVAYVATIPGAFDRTATAAALIVAVQAKRDLAYTAPRKITGNPALPAIAHPAAAEYGYCPQAEAPADLEALSVRVAAVLGAGGAWTLGGQLKFVRAEADCNLAIRLVSPAVITALDPACAGHTTCQVGNVIGLNRDMWLKPPAAWTGGSDAYHGEMIDHEVGHWLGFDHASCLDTAAPKPILQAPTVVLGGCSPNWYEIPADTQGTKVLAGF
ncbi:MAG: uncharacterized protein JWN01_887 [Patescibacteria group bacterium]|nr:uncharacterized protein [Patescibacteria group bacterium]